MGGRYSEEETWLSAIETKEKTVWFGISGVCNSNEVGIANIKQLIIEQLIIEQLTPSEQ